MRCAACVWSSEEGGEFCTKRDVSMVRAGGVCVQNKATRKKKAGRRGTGRHVRQACGMLRLQWGVSRLQHENMQAQRGERECGGGFRYRRSKRA